MKNFFALALAFMVFIPNAMADATMSCANIANYNYDTGEFDPGDLTVLVNSSASGKYGYVATLTNKEGTRSETDVEMSSRPAKGENSLEEMAGVVFPKLKWKNVHTIQIANVGVEANLDDANGIYIYELLDKKQEVLGKMASVGWGMGRCTE